MTRIKNSLRLLPFGPDRVGEISAHALSMDNMGGFAANIKYK